MRMAEQVAVPPVGFGSNLTSDISFSMLSVVANIEICFRLLSFIDSYHLKLNAYSKAIYGHYKNHNLSVTYFCILFHQGAR